ncbi:unnamed protein product [Bemisia tabaci]|uniref:Uncharacterized protein n=2 Tax=Bemisia tabaci TaxID=7038 RepID=A0A9P0ALF4_BEMTA|nr:unnamed protein product [Bemisia tabaci]
MDTVCQVSQKWTHVFQKRYLKYVEYEVMRLKEGSDFQPRSTRMSKVIELPRSQGDGQRQGKPRNSMDMYRPTAKEVLHGLLKFQSHQNHCNHSNHSGCNNTTQNTPLMREDSLESQSSQPGSPVLSQRVLSGQTTTANHLTSPDEKEEEEEEELPIVYSSGCLLPPTANPYDKSQKIKEANEQLEKSMRKEKKRKKKKQSREVHFNSVIKMEDDEVADSTPPLTQDESMANCNSKTSEEQTSKIDPTKNDQKIDLDCTPLRVSSAMPTGDPPASKKLELHRSVSSEPHFKTVSSETGSTKKGTPKTGSEDEDSDVCTGRTGQGSPKKVKAKTNREKVMEYLTYPFFRSTPKPRFEQGRCRPEPVGRSLSEPGPVDHMISSQSVLSS